jgi:hypothetical protein
VVDVKRLLKTGLWDHRREPSEGLGKRISNALYDAKRTEGFFVKKPPTALKRLHPSLKPVNGGVKSGHAAV